VWCRSHLHSFVDAGGTLYATCSSSQVHESAWNDLEFLITWIRAGGNLSLSQLSAAARDHQDVFLVLACIQARCYLLQHMSRRLRDSIPLCVQAVKANASLECLPHFKRRVRISYEVWLVKRSFYSCPLSTRDELFRSVTRKKLIDFRAFLYFLCGMKDHSCHLCRLDLGNGSFVSRDIASFLGLPVESHFIRAVRRLGLLETLASSEVSSETSTNSSTLSSVSSESHESS